MRRFRSPALFAACFSLIVLQLSGLHMHLNEHGYSGTPQGTHVHGPAPQHNHAIHDGAHEHGAAAHDHGQTGHPDHSGDTDVSVVELGAGVSKLLLIFVCLGLVLLVLSRSSVKPSFNHVVPLPIGRHARWRPPLRAPPHLA
jgi:hypothetical protein